MGAVLDFLDRLWTSVKARKASKAAADVEAGKVIIAQAQKEADEMAAAGKSLDAELSTVPKVIVDPQLTLPLVKP